MKKKNRKRMIFGIAGILFMAGAVIGIIGVLEKGEKEQKQTRTKTDTIETASELEQEKGMPTGSDDEKVKTETTPKGTEEEVTAVTESPEKTETEDIAEPLEQAGKRGDDEKKTDEQTEQTVEEKAQNMMEHMSLEEKIYQLFVVTPEQLTGVSTVTMAGDTTRAALEAQPVGGIVFFAPNLLNREQTITMIQNMQSYSKTGLFIAVDEEGGSVMRLGNNSEMGITAIPSMESVGDTEDISQAYRVGNTIGSEISQLGFNLDFAPVADVNSNPNNTVIGSRAFGTDPEKVAEMVAACVKGFRDSGMVCTLKHFPGHGDTEEDSHYGEAKSWKTLDELRTCELRPFQAGIEAGASMIMVGHITLPNVTEEIPATLSHDIVTGILREEMKYNGIIITDSMAMNAIANWYSSDEAAVKAIQAGCDMILMPYQLESAVNGIETAVNSGDITEERIEESVLRILKVKLEAGIIEN